MMHCRIIKNEFCNTSLLSSSPQGMILVKINSDSACVHSTQVTFFLVHRARSLYSTSEKSGEIKKPYEQPVFTFSGSVLHMPPAR